MQFLGVPGTDGDQTTNATESTAMKHARILFSLAVLALTATPALARSAYVASTVNLRAAPGTTSEIVGKIPGGSVVDAKDCSEGWCAVSWHGKSGFSIQTALDMSGRLPNRTARRAYRPDVDDGPDADYGPGRGYVVEGGPVYAAPPPVYYSGPYYGPYYRPYWGWRRHWW